MVDELDAGDRLMTSLPLFHINAPAYSVLGSVAARAGLVLLERFSASTFLESARRHGATQFNAIGAMLEILMRQPERPDDAETPLRLCYTGPSPPRERQLEIERRLGLRIVDHTDRRSSEAMTPEEPWLRTSVGTSDADSITVQGRDLASELMGKVSFTELAFLLVRGRLPDAGETTMLDAVLVSLADHGLTPTVIAARMTHTGAPESLPGAVAAGLLGAGDVFLGVVENTARFLGDILRGDRAADRVQALRRHRAARDVRAAQVTSPGRRRLRRREGETSYRSAMRLPRWPTPNVASIPATTKASVRSVPSSSESPVSM